MSSMREACLRKKIAPSIHELQTARISQTEIVSRGRRKSSLTANLIDRHAAVRGLKTDGGAAGAELGVDGVAVDAVLVGVGNVERGAAVGGVGYEMGGVVGGELDGDAAVGGASGEAASLPGGAGEV